MQTKNPPHRRLFAFSHRSSTHYSFTILGLGRDVIITGILTSFEDENYIN